MASEYGQWTITTTTTTPTSGKWSSPSSPNQNNPTYWPSLDRWYFSTTDKDGGDQLASLQNILAHDVITLTGENGNTWTVTVSGEPSVAAGVYAFPITTSAFIPIYETNPDAANIGALSETITLWGPSRGGSSPTVSFTTTGLDVAWNAASYPSNSRNYLTREGRFRKEIYRLTQARSNISYIYRESLRSMIASFNDVGYISSEEKFTNIKCIHANAERAVAKLKQENNIILPIISIAQTTTDNDDTRRRNESVLINEQYWDSNKERAFRILSLSPRPVNINYQVNVWCKYMSDMDQILEQIRLKFNPELQVPTKYSTLAKAFIQSEDELGAVTAGDKEDRVIKKTVNLILRTYIPSPKFLLTSTGKITEFKVEQAL